MKSKFLFLFLLASVVGWGQSTITINLTSAGGSSNLGNTNYGGGAERVWTQNGVNFGGKQITANGSNIQVAATDGVFYNTSALPGRILNVVINYSGTARTYNFYGGNASRLVNSTTANYNVTGGTQVGASSSTGWLSTEFNSTNYTYFAIKRASTNASQIVSIVITYEDAPTCSAPTVALQATPVQNISSTGADLYGDVTGVGGGTNVTQRGFQYSTNTNMTSASTVQENAGTGTYNLSIGSLTRNTRYYYRALAVNDCSTPQTGYSSTTPVGTSFVTKQLATTANDATNIESYSFRANWENPSSGGGGETFTYKLVVERWDGSSWVAFNTYTGISSSTPYYDVNSGLMPNMLYRYYFYSVNEGGESDIPSNMKEVRTLSEVSWANLQFPSSITINEGGNFTVYGRVYAAGLTEISGDPGITLEAQIGFSLAGENTNPNTWTNWTNAAWNAQFGNNDEYQANAGANLAPGIYRYAYRFRVGNGTWTYGGTGGVWNNDSGVLTVNSLIGFANFQSPCTGTTTLGSTYDVFGRIYADGITNPAGSNNRIEAQVGYNPADTNPNTWSNWHNADWNVQYGNDDEYMLNIGQHFTAPGTYYMAFRYRVDGGAWYYGGRKSGICDGTGGGQWNGTTNINAEVSIIGSEITDHFRTKQNGNWNAFSTWESSPSGTAGSWINATLTPTSAANTITIQSGHTVNVNAGVSADQLTLNTGSILTINNVTLTLNNGTGTDMTVNGTLNLSGNSGVINQVSSSTIIFGANSFYNHNRNGGTIPTATWDATSTCSVNGMTFTNPSYASFSQNFGNFIWNSNQTAFVNLDNTASGFSTQGLFTIANTGTTYNFCLSQNSGTDVTYSFGAIRVFNNANLQLTYRNSTNAGIVTVNVAGNVDIENSGTIEFGAGTSDANNGDFRSIMNIGGDLNVSSGGYLWLSGNNNSYGKVVFSKNGIQNYSNLSSNTFAIVHEITNSSVLNIGSDINLDDYNGFDVYGTINLGNHEIIGNDFDDFYLHDDATLITSHPEGISALGTNLGSIQVGYERDYDIDGIYVYNGSTNQNTGNGLPEIVQSVIIENTGTTNNNEVTLTNGELGVSDNLYVNSGIFNLNGLEVYGGGVPASELKIAENAELKIGGTQSFPGEFGTITFEPLSNVHYAGANQTIATSDITVYSNLPDYENLTVSGTGIKTSGGKNLFVNNLTSVISSELRIPESIDSETPYILYATKGINVATTGATLLLQNNANLMQNIGVTNSGNITQLRKATVPSNQYNFWASPVKSQLLYSLYPGIPVGKVMVYNTATDYFNALPVSSNPTSSFGKGYSIKGSNQPAHAPNVTATFVGVPQNESLTSTENLISLSNVGQRFNLIGNPFPSNLDLKLLNDHISNSGKIENSTFYFWDNTDNTATTQQGSSYVNLNYANYNASSDVGTAAPRFGAVGKKPNGIVKPGQGFIVKATAGTTGIIVENSMRTTAIRQTTDTEDAVYFKNGEGSVDDIYSSRPRNDKFWLEMVNPLGMHVQIAVGYFKQAENTFETYDSKILSESVSDNLYSLSKDAHKLSIQGRQAPFENTDVIPLGVKFFVQGKYKIQLEETLGIFKVYQNIYLKDKYLNEIHNLSESPYDFEGTPGVFEDRFEIIFQDVNNVTDPVLSTATDNDVKITKKNRQIEITSSKDKILEVEIFNLSGWSVYKNEKVNSNVLNVPASLFGKQIIVVKVQTETGEIVTKKIINK